MTIGHPRNFWGGILFIALGLLFAVIAIGFKVGDTQVLKGYAMGTPARMGPGFFPFYLGAILVVLGLVIAATALKRGSGDAGDIERFHWRPILWVLGAVVLFGVALKAVGMLAAGLMLVILASRGSPSFEFKRSLVLGTALSVFCALVFVGGLKLPIPLCPDIELVQASIPFCRT